MRSRIWTTPNATCPRLRLSSSAMDEVASSSIQINRKLWRMAEAFSRIEELRCPVTRPDRSHAWHLYVIELDTRSLQISRSEFIDALREQGIGTSVHFIPLHLHPYYRERFGFRPDDFPVASAVYERIVSLPIYPAMSDGDVDDVIDSVAEVVERARTRTTVAGSDKNIQLIASPPSVSSFCSASAKSAGWPAVVAALPGFWPKRTCAAVGLGGTL